VDGFLNAGTSSKWPKWERERGVFEYGPVIGTEYGLALVGERAGAGAVDSSGLEIVVGTPGIRELGNDCQRKTGAEERRMLTHSNARFIVSMRNSTS
jgi:hypothetical protein